MVAGRRQGCLLECWWFLSLDLSAAYTDLLTLWPCIELYTYYACIFPVCIPYFSKNTPPEKRNSGTPIIRLYVIKKSSGTIGKIYRMLWIVILLKLTFVSVLSTKINTSILKTFAKETNVFDEKAKNAISFGKHLWDWR